jgi:hypothetical protein
MDPELKSYRDISDPADCLQDTTHPLAAYVTANGANLHGIS